MSPMPLLLALLVVAYIGSMWVSARGSRSFGSPSGVEYVVLGFLLGPRALGVLGDAALAVFEPLAQLALGWLALGYGLECGMLGERRTSARRILLGTLFAAITASVCALSAGVASYHLGHALDRELLLASAALGLVSAETTRHAVRWVADRHIARGPLSSLVAELAAADDAFVIVALSILFALTGGPGEVLGRHVPAWGFAVGTLGLGVLLGLGVAWLLTHALRKVEWWTVLLGSASFAIGACSKLGLTTMGATFALGLTLSTVSREAPKLRTMVANTEGPVLLPALLLAGAHLGAPSSAREGILIAATISARALAGVITGSTLAMFRARTRPAAGWLGLGMLSSGTLSMLVGFSIALRFEPTIGRVALLVAASGTLLGELVGPFALQRALTRAGELSPAEASTVQLAAAPDDGSREAAS